MDLNMEQTDSNTGLSVFAATPAIPGDMRA